jgi:hypothetical protein
MKLSMTAKNAFARSVLFSGIVGLVLAAAPAHAGATAYGGRGVSVSATLPLLPTINVNDTGPLPSSGGSIKTTLLEVNAANGAIRSEHVSASTSGANEESYSEAFVSRGSATVGAYVITWDAVSAWAAAICCTHEGGAPEIGGKAQILNLRINGVAVDGNAAPNTTIPLVGGRIVINEQITYLDATQGRITVNAIHVVLDGVADVVISSASASIVCDLL